MSQKCCFFVVLVVIYIFATYFFNSASRRKSNRSTNSETELISYDDSENDEENFKHANRNVFEENNLPRPNLVSTIMIGMKILKRLIEDKVSSFNEFFNCKINRIQIYFLFKNMIQL